MSVAVSGNYHLAAGLLRVILVVLGLTTVASAQADSPPPPPRGGMVTIHGPGAAGDVMYFGMGEGKQVKGAPMRGDFVVTRDTTLADGTHIHNVSQTKIYRDAEGRVRREIGIDLKMPSTGAVKHMMIMIIDPVAGYRYMLNPSNKTARQMQLRPLAGKRENEASGDAGAPGQNMLSHLGSLKTEDLGTKTVNGSQAQGTRVTRTIAAGEIGNDRPIEVVTERWVSLDLQVPVLVTHNDPLMGTVTSRLTNIARGDQEASLFQVPADYRVERGRRDEPFFVPMQH